MDRAAIQTILPHRDPFLWVDRIVELSPGHAAVGELYVKPEFPFFQGHYPGAPVMPGVLLIEALAQVGGVAILSAPEFQGKLAFLAGVTNAKFRNKVLPGDTLRLETTIHKLGSRAGQGHAVASVNGEVKCQTDIFFVLGDPPEENDV